METSPLRRRRAQRGFTLIETLIAMVILCIGLLSLAGLMSRTLIGSNQSRYISQATSLATEKLEDMNRFPSNAPDVGAGGSLTTDQTSPDGTIFYYDNVQVSTTNGVISEVRNSSTCATGYDVFSHSIVSGSTQVSDQCATPPTVTPDSLVYHRRWLIESPVTLNGNSISSVRRVTVWVQLQTTTAGVPVTFQMSAIRP
jgi:type IV pilus assembly protein PilV